MKKYIAVLSMSLALVAASGANAADIAKGKAKAGACMGCHGADGNSRIPGTPSLAGQSAEYLVKQMQDFKTGMRMDGKDGLKKGTMNTQVATLTKVQMENIAAYFASKKIKAGLATKDLKELGKKIYVGGNKKTGVPACVGCHGPAGRGISTAGFPAIGGQNAMYTVKQLKLFRMSALDWETHKNAKKDLPKTRRGRTNDKNFRMQVVVMRMTDTEIKAVASYLQGLRVRK